jgi:hypothetical protein
METFAFPYIRSKSGWVFINPAVLFIPTWEFIKSMMSMPSLSGSAQPGKSAPFSAKVTIAMILIFALVFIIGGISQAIVGKQ